MELAPREGRLLVAHRDLLDPNFFRTVVLVCRHDDEQGTVGLVLNRPTEVTLGKVLPQAAADRPEPLWVGGPVEGRCLWVLHRDPELADPERRVADGVWFGGDPRLLQKLVASPVPDEEGHVFRLFVGYAGWSARQLRQEIAEGAWRVVPAAPELLFAREPQRVWAEMSLRAMIPWNEEGAEALARSWRN